MIEIPPLMRAGALRALRALHAGIGLSWRLVRCVSIWSEIQVGENKICWSTHLTGRDPLSTPPPTGASESLPRIKIAGHGS
jgi:hypothetical protein